MLHFELTETNGTTTTTRRISLPDDSRGADLYLAYRKRGCSLRRISLDSEAE